MLDLVELDSLTRIILAASFVLIAAAISRWQRADLEKDLVMATVRSFLQLIAIGYALELIFEQDSPLWMIVVLVIMTVVAARTTAARAKSTPNAQAIALISIGFGSVLTIGLLVALGVFDFKAQAVIPIGGMVIGNSMTTATLVIKSLTTDIQTQRLQIESMLALGATGREASLPQFRRSIRNAMIPIIDTTKTVGLIKLPGAMTGMILAGASPIQAVQLQIIVMYMLVGASTFTGLSSAYLTYQQLFTPQHQLKIIQTVEPKKSA
jgi:putative ABC transport system permease protein